MTLFWALVALFAAAALAFVLPPLLRRAGEGDGAAVDATNVAVYRDQLRELDADVAAGTLSPEQHVEARREIDVRLLDDVGAPGGAPPAAHAGRWAAVAVGALLPLAAVLLYLAVGNPAALTREATQADAHGITREKIEGLIEQLAARMKEAPDDPKGWMMLGRSYAVLDRFEEAAAAYANAVKRSPPDAQLLADYADALAMSRGRNLLGEPERLIAQALKIDPANVKALALAGTAAFERKDFQGAIAHWEKILALVPPDSDMAGSVRDSMADARSLAGGGAPGGAQAVQPQPVETPAAAASTVRGTVRLAPALAAKAEPTDTVFIFARAASGPRMPLAVLRKQVRDLPVAFALDDSMAMTPAARLSNHASVVVGARVSKRGGPTPQPGDLEGLSAPVTIGQSGIVVVIDREVTATE